MIKKIKKEEVKTYNIRKISKLLGVMILFVILFIATAFIINKFAYFTDTKISIFCNSKEGYVKEECFSRLAMIKNDTKICDNVKDDIKKDYCKEKIAEKIKDIEICRSLSSAYWSDICFDNLAHENKDIKTCNNVENMDMRKRCLYDLALLRADINLCLSSNNPLKCQFAVALNERNTTICKEKIPNIINRNVCIYKIAKNENDINICNEIKIKEIKARCISVLS